MAARITLLKPTLKSSRINALGVMVSHKVSDATRAGSKYSRSMDVDRAKNSH